MKAYGVKRGDRGCCPGHDKYPADSYNTRRSKREHTRLTREAHGRARAEAKAEIRNARGED